MDKIPISFDFRGVHYSGQFTKVSGAGRSSVFHLLVDNFYFGQLWFSDRWRFESNAHEDMRELAEEFGAVVTGWYG